MIYTVGVGSKAGDLIPIQKPDGSVDYVRDAAGKVVKTKLDEETLKKIASATGGFYVPLGSRGEGLESVYEAGLNSVPQQELTSSLRQVPIEHFQLPLGIAFLFFFMEPFFSTRKASLNLKGKALKLLGRHSMLILIIVLTVGFMGERVEGSEATDGYKAYVKGDYREAVKHFTEARHKDLRDAELPYNLGIAQYRAGDYEGAIHSFNDTLAFHNVQLQDDTFYNLGNSYYQVGVETLKTNPQSLQLVGKMPLRITKR